MRFKTTTANHASVLSAEIDEFDGCPPVTDLEIGVALDGVSPDRVAVGATLAFAPWLAGPMEVPKPVSALTAQRIGEFFGMRWVHCVSVSRGALPITRGGRTLGLRHAGDSVGSGLREELLIDSVSSFAGIRTEGDTMAIATNAAMLSPRGTDRQMGFADLGVAVLVASYLDVNEYVCPGLARQDRDAFDRATILLESVGLGLSG
ncbi:MAG TPA: hypothetical protein VFJ94_01170 [Intrasporangium sp.]|uniref:hypothetical protein n=1 Tax=Intrasporangium sp. TaxID=1925024 RepID=UPI002D78F363|nr:hypothetical protein [Intrasporangium sp.]HET7397102.1 hypothetical protein [Intrasporangium sp.]